MYWQDDCAFLINACYSLFQLWVKHEAPISPLNNVVLLHLLYSPVRWSRHIHNKASQIVILVILHCHLKKYFHFFLFTSSLLEQFFLLTWLFAWRAAQDPWCHHNFRISSVLWDTLAIILKYKQGLSLGWTTTCEKDQVLRYCLNHAKSFDLLYQPTWQTLFNSFDVFCFVMW